MAGEIAVTPGLQRDAQRQIMGAAGEAFGVDLTPANPSPFRGTDTLACRVWAGAQTAAIVTPTCTWLDATGIATYQFTLSGTQTALLAPGIYRFLTTVSRGGATGEVDRGRIRVGLAPGAETVPLAFTTRADLLQYASFLEDLDGADDETAFAEEQARATNQLISDLVTLWKNGAGLAPQMGQPGWNAGTLFGFGGAPPSKWLRDVITPLVPDSTPPADMLPNRTSTAVNLITDCPGNLRVSTALLLYPEVREICARRAISYVCERQLGAADDAVWLDRGRLHRAMASSLFRSYKFAIDISIPQTGWASITIHGGVSSLR